MNNSVRKNWLLLLSIFLAGLGAPLGVAHAQTTNWVAYNDQVPNYIPTNGWVTHPRTTVIDMGELGGTGNLTNFLDGQRLPVVMTSFHTGPIHNFGLAVGPSDNTPAARIFKGIVDVSNENSAQPSGNLIGVQFSPNDYATFMFSGLDPNKRYVFRGTAVRGGSYPLRWSVATIIGAQTWVDAHINGNGGPGVITSNNYPNSLGVGQAAWNAGDNRQGAVIGWDFITPALDGTFSIQSSNYIGEIPNGVAANNTYSYAINAMLLAEVEVAPPAIAQQPAAQTDVEQNRPFSLAVSASGTPLLYQWYKKAQAVDTEISGATFPTYSVSQAALSDSGEYYVVVYNPLARETSSVARVTVNADVTGPGIATAFSYPTVDFATQAASLDQVIIEFNETIQASGATDPVNYVISGGIGNPASVILTNDRTVVLQLSTALNEDTPYTVQVGGIIDLIGNNISNGGTNNPAPFRSWMRGPGNGLAFEVFDGIAGGTVTALTSSPLYPDRPTFRTNLWIFDSRGALPDDGRENYGARTRGVFIPPVSGNWIFYLRGIDICRLFLNPNGLGAAGRQFMCEEAHEDTDGNWGRVLSSPVSLRAGQGYYIEALHKSNTGADFVKVAARLVGSGVPAGVANTQLDTNAIMGAAIGSPLAPRDLGGTLAIVQGPTNLTVEANHFATFSVQVSNPSGLPVTYQWFRDDVLIGSAFSATYSFVASSGDDQAVYRVEASKVGSFVASGNATLTVVPDTTPPHAISATCSYSNLSVVRVVFDEFIDAELAGDEFTYSLGETIQIDEATLEPDGTNVTLVLLDPLIAGNAYTLEIGSIVDLANNLIDPVPTFLTFVAAADVPLLKVKLVDNYANVSWPTTFTDWYLEQANNLTGGAWTPAPGVTYVENGHYVLSLTVEPGNKFFRLRPPGP